MEAWTPKEYQALLDAVAATSGSGDRHRPSNAGVLSPPQSPNRAQRLLLISRHIEQNTGKKFALSEIQRKLAGLQNRLHASPTRTVSFPWAEWKSLHAFCRPRMCASFVPDILHGNENPAQMMTSMLQSCIEDRESHSMLIIGPPGSGKTALVRHSLQVYDLIDSSSNSREGVGGEAPAAHVITVQGMTVTDDRSFIRAILSQLQDPKTAALEGTKDSHTDGGTGGSGPKQVFRDGSNQLPERLLAHFQASFGKPIILILENFEHIAQCCRKSIYTLLNVLQSPQCVLTMIGTSRSMLAMEYLEKRAKSRFSHRQIILGPVHSVDTVAAAVRQRWRIPGSISEVSLSTRSRFNVQLDRCIKSGSPTAERIRLELQQWLNSGTCDWRTMMRYFNAVLARADERLTAAAESGTAITTQELLVESDFLSTMREYRRGLTDLTEFLRTSMTITELTVLIALYRLRNRPITTTSTAYTAYQSYLSGVTEENITGSIRARVYEQSRKRQRRTRKTAAAANTSTETDAPAEREPSQQGMPFPQWRQAVERLFHSYEAIRIGPNFASDAIAGTQAENMALTTPKTAAEWDNAPLCLIISPDEVRDIVQRYPDCPTSLQRWLAM